MYFDTRHRNRKKAANAPPKQRVSDRTPQRTPNFLPLCVGGGRKFEVRSERFSLCARRRDLSERRTGDHFHFLFIKRGTGCVIGTRSVRNVCVKLSDSDSDIDASRCDSTDTYGRPHPQIKCAPANRRIAGAPCSPHSSSSEERRPIWGIGEAARAPMYGRMDTMGEDQRCDQGKTGKPGQWEKSA